MGVVRGDRIKESQKLNHVSLEAFFAYALCVDVLPDDFGRFRCNPKLAASHLAPRREDVTAELVGRVFDEYEREELIRTWEVDGERFGEFTGFKTRGNKYHRTPEPPWGGHDHQGRCLATAIHRAKEWGAPEEAEALSIRMRQLRDREPASRRAVRQDPVTRADQAPGSAAFSPTPPFPSVPLHSPPTEDSNGSSARSAHGVRRTLKALTVEANVEAPGVEVVIPTKPWNQLMCEDWIARFGGTAPGARITKATKPLLVKNSPEAVRDAWRNYLSQAEAEYASPERFAQTFGRWEGNAPRGSPSKPTVGDRIRAEGERFLNGRRG